MLRPLVCSFACALGLVLGGSARADERSDLEVRGEVLEQLDALAGDDFEARQRAVERLAELGAAAKPYLQQALRSLDPEVRFYVLFVLQADDVRVERLVRQIVEGHTDDAGTYPEALEARRELTAIAGGSKLTMLARIAQRYGADTNKLRNERYVITALDLLWEQLALADPAELPADLAGAMARLCELNLGDAYHELAHAFWFLPPEQAHAALRTQLAEGSPLGRAGAARVLGEFVRAEHAPQAVMWVAPLLRAEEPEVREAALVALDVMPLRDDLLSPVLGLLSDKAPRVARTALRIAGERGLAFARDQAEAIARDPRRALSVRLEAVRALGLIGDARAAQTLRPLSDPAISGKELGVLAIWGRAAVRAQGGIEAVEGLLELQFPQEDALYFGLARAGGIPGLTALKHQLARGLDVGRVLRGLASVQDGRELAVTELRGFAARNRGGYFQLAINALLDVAADLDQREPGGREKALEALARLFLESDDEQQRDLLLPAFSRVGGPSDPLLKAQLAQKLAGAITSARLTRMRREGAADALARVDAAQALAAIRRQLEGATLGRSDQMRDYARSLVRSMARAGDSSRVAEIALPYSREQVEAAQPDQRAWRQNDVGIDLLYAKQLDEAILEFRRMVWCRPQDNIAAYNIACGYALAGKVDESLRYLRRSIRNGYDDPRHMRTDTDLDVLHDDPRFQRMVRRMLLQEETGLSRPDESWPRME